MKKEDFLKLGLTDEQADKAASASAEELKGFIPKARFDEVNDSKKQLEADIKVRDKQLNDLKSVDADALKDEIKKLEDTNKANKDKYDADIKALKISTAVKSAVKAAKAKNDKAVMALLDLEGAELADDDTIKGLDKQLKSLLESDDTKFLFDSDSDAGNRFKGTKPGDKKDGTPGTLTKEQFSRMGYKERNELYNSDKATYDALVTE